MNHSASKLSKITLSIFCLGSFLFLIFRTDVPESTPVPTSLIHGFAALIALIALGITMIAWGAVFNENEYWKSLAKPSFFFGLMCLILFFVFKASSIPLKGLAERILLIWDLSWLLLVSKKLYRNVLLPAQQLPGLVAARWRSEA